MKNIVFIILITFPTWLFGQNTATVYNFSMPYDDATSQTFLPNFPITPIIGGQFILTNRFGQFELNMKQIRFWGTNLAGRGAFLEKEDARAMAPRLRKMGFNLVRLHHLDNPWAKESLFSNYPNITTREFNIENLDKLDYLIDQLKRQGIYINMNLHVGRTFTVNDGVPEADSIAEFGIDFYKGISFFDPWLISLQKEYARDLLTRINPYTKRALVNDPVMAMVEIANENSLFLCWKDGDLKHFSEGGKISWRHKLMLDSLWNTYLSEKYSTTENLRSAWGVGSNAGTTQLLVNGDFSPSLGTESWELEVHSPGEAQMATLYDLVMQNDVCGIRIDQSGNQAWQIQLKQAGLTVAKDTIYRISFYAKSNNLNNVATFLLLDEEPFTPVFWRKFTITNRWTKYSAAFKATSTMVNNGRLSFNLGDQKGALLLDSISLKPERIGGLDANENLAKGSVRLIEFYERYGYSEQRLIDQVQFFEHLQTSFFKDMYTFLKDSLGVRVPITGTNLYAGLEDLKIQEELDYVDNHAYWDHPRFYNEPWDAEDWRIDNKPMVQSDDRNTIHTLYSGYQIKGMPSTVSEYNHCFPNQYQSELLPFLASYASFHDNDAVMLFPYGGDYQKEDHIHLYFAINRNALIMSGSPLFAFMYRNNLVKKDPEPIYINYDTHTTYTSQKLSDGNWGPVFHFDRDLALEHSVQIASFDADKPTDLSTLPSVSGEVFTTSTDEITWDRSQGVLITDALQFKNITGYFINAKDIHPDAMKIERCNQFGSVSWMSLDTNSVEYARKSILHLSSKAQNSNMLWNFDSTSVHNNWGTSPTEYDALQMAVQLKTHSSYLHIFPLDVYGQEDSVNSFFVKADTMGFASFFLDQNIYKTPWFGISATDSIELVHLPSRYRVPGIIEAENFDNGAYFDITEENSGTKYRPAEAVDIRSCGSGCYAVGWIGSGEWLEYTIDADASGFYNTNMLYATPNADCQIKLLVNNTLSGIIRLNNTGSWKNWQVDSSKIFLNKGIQTIRLEVVTGGFDFNRFDFQYVIDTQRIDLTAGTNLVSLYIEPLDSAIRSVFPNAESVKTMHYSWHNYYPEHINGIHYLQPGVGYIINNNVNEIRYITGHLQEPRYTVDRSTGWQLTNAARVNLISKDYFGNDLPNIKIIKDLHTIWNVDGSGNLDTIQKGKGYFIYREE